MSLTDLQKRFVEEYLKDNNGKQAAIRAGYNPNNACVKASELKKHPKVKKALDEARAELSERTKIEQDYVVNTLVETIERCKQVHPVLDRKGNQVYVPTADGEIKPAFTFDANAVLRGSELLGKHLGMFKEKVEVDHGGGVNINIKFTDD